MVQTLCARQTDLIVLLKLIKTRDFAGFFTFEDRLLTFRAGKPPLLNHPKHIAHVLEQYPGDVGDGVDVVFGVVGEVGAAHELQVGEDGVEAFADAVVEFAQRGVAVDDQDGVIGCELSHGDEAVRRKLGCHVNLTIKSDRHLFAANQMGGSCA
ncbi:hypothetical protein EMIT0P12_30037 [Pseudomonas sp. IT-P12]